MSILKKVVVGSLAVAAIAGLSKAKGAPKRKKAATKRTARKGKARAKRAARRA